MIVIHDVSSLVFLAAGASTGKNICPGADPDRFPPFYLKRLDFWKMDNFLK